MTATMMARSTMQSECWTLLQYDQCCHRLVVPQPFSKRVISACRFVAMLRKDNDLQQATSFFKGLRLPEGALK